MNTYQYIGKDLPNDRARGKVTGTLRYTGDIRTPGMLYLRYAHGTITHGMIRSIDTTAAEALPGVRGIFTCDNTPNTLFDRGRVDAWENAPDQEVLFDRHIRYYGQPIAAVAAISEEIAERAARLISVEYEELPAVISVKEAAKSDAIPLFEGGNLFPIEDYDHGDYNQAPSDLTHTSTTHISRMTHLCMETQSCRALWDPADEKLTIWTGCQSVFGVRNTVAALLNLPYTKVRVMKMPMGGSFGVKQETVAEPLTAYAAWKLKADVRLIYTREEQMMNTMMKHSLDARVESKVLADGTITGLSMSVTMDAGAYLTVSQDYVGTMCAKIGKVYPIPNLHFEGQAVCTNTPINGSFRSWGSSEDALCLENHWNQVADRLQMDPIDFRLKNCHTMDSTDIPNNASVCQVHFRECLEQGRDRFRWQERRENCAKRNQEQKRYRYGVGVGMASNTSSFYPYRTEIATTGVHLQADGSLILHVTIHDHGCGTVLAMKKIAAEVTGIPMERIVLGEADTENGFYDHGCYASRSVYALGQSVKQACEKLLKLLRLRAARILECSAEELDYDGEYFHRMASDSLPGNAPDEKAPKVSLGGLVEYGIRYLAEDTYCAVTYSAQASPGVPAVHLTEVEVDTYTGRTRILDCLSVHDIGRAINPAMCRGQVGSGIQQGMGIALCEEMKIDPITGRSLINNFKNYEVANACEMPDFDVLFIEDEEPSGPFGAKSIGEVALAPVAPAIVAAVNHALGTELTHLPLTPAKILEAVHAARKN